MDRCSWRRRQAALIAGLGLGLGLGACTSSGPPTAVDGGRAEPVAEAPAGGPATPAVSAAEGDARPRAPGDPPRLCGPNERLDSGCACPEGACFDICCGPQADCAHPAIPGGPSACILRPLDEAPEAAPTEAAPAEPPASGERPCADGESLASGCACERRCMDICCVGSACSHRNGPDGAWAKCMRIPRTR